MERVPQIAAAQAMGALSSQATVAGYKAVLVGAAALKRMMPMLITTAGRLVPGRQPGRRPHAPEPCFLLQT